MSIYWIDDKKGSMLNITEGILINLWNVQSCGEWDPIKSKIYIFGNMIHQNPEMLLTEKEERKFRISIEDKFKKYCDSIDGVDPERRTFREKKELVKDIASFVYKKEDAVEKQEEYKQIIRLCDSEEFQNPENKGCNRGQDISKLIAQLGIEKNEPALAAVDVMLIQGDFERCLNDKFIISMELCHQFSVRKIPRFLYSMDATKKEMITKWQQTYKKVYPDDELPKTFLREDFGEKMRLDTARKIVQLHDNIKQ